MVAVVSRHRVAVLEPDPLRRQNGDMTSEEIKWQRVEQEWERIMRDLRKKATDGLAQDGNLSDLDMEFYRIVLAQTENKG